MQPNNNLSCIPFYDNLNKQDYRKWYAYGEKYPHRVPSDYLLPFFFFFEIAPHDKSTESVLSTEITDITFFRACCDEPEPITGSGSFNLSFSDAFDNGSFKGKMMNNGLELMSEITPNSNMIVYNAAHIVPLGLENGLYYMKITIADTIAQDSEEYTMYRYYYSDIFQVDTRENLKANSIRIEWWNEDNLEYDGGFIPYDTEYLGRLFKNDIFLDSEIGKPTYKFVEEGEERNGYFFPIKQLSEKSYNMSFLAPEYLCDVMRLIRMADTIRITDKLGRVYNVEQFEMEVNWMEQGHYARVDCSFETDTVVKKIGKAYNEITDRTDIENEDE